MNYKYLFDFIIKEMALTTNEIIFIFLLVIGIIIVITGIIIAGVWTGYEWYIWTIIGIGGVLFIGGLLGLGLHYLQSRQDKSNDVILNQEQVTKNPIDQAKKEEARRNKCYERYIDNVNPDTLTQTCRLGSTQLIFDKINDIDCPLLGTTMCQDQDKIRLLSQKHTTRDTVKSSSLNVPGLNNNSSTQTDTVIRTIKASDITSLSPNV